MMESENNNDILYDTEHYVLQIGESVHNNSEYPFECYQIINRDTAVIELETTLYPKAVHLMHQLEEEWDSVFNAPGAADEETPGSVTAPMLN